MKRHAPIVVAAACAAGVACLVFCAALHPVSGRAWGRPAVGGAGEARGADVARGEDVLGRKMPPLDFDRWIDAEGGGAADPSGKVTLYRWWTDGCAHCEKTLPAVETLRRNYGPKGLRVVAVYHPKPVREVDDEAVRRAAARVGYSGPVAVDGDWSELKKFYLDTGERPATSASFLVDRHGVIRLVHPGPRFHPSDDPAEAAEAADYRRIEAAVERLLDGGR